jgi:peptidoglycan biosynthesis protein MviN/MurJ (putative lipid II flippase)
MVTFGQIGVALAVLAAVAVLVYVIRSGKLRGFWNDRDGVTITDFLALVFAAAHMVVSWYMIDKLRTSTLTDQDVDFFEVYSWGMLTILGGYFLDRTAGSVMDRLPQRRRKQEPLTNTDAGGMAP